MSCVIAEEDHYVEMCTTWNHQKPTPIRGEVTGRERAGVEEWQGEMGLFPLVDDSASILRVRLGRESRFEGALDAS